MINSRTLPSSTVTGPSPLDVEVTCLNVSSGLAPAPFGTAVPDAAHLPRALLRVAAARPDSPAMTTAQGTVNYGQLSAAIQALASRLLNSDTFHPGDRVVTLLPNSVEYVAAFYGVLLAGGVVVPVPTSAESGLLRQIVAATDTRQVLTSSRVAATCADLRESPQTTWNLEDQSFTASPAHLPSANEDDIDQLAAIFFTAGSTGTPKGVMLSHGNFLSNARSIQEYLEIGPDDRPLCVLPFHHAFGNSVLQSHLLAGAQLILDGSTSFPQTLLDALIRHECTSLSGVPDLFRLLLDRTGLGTVPLLSLRHAAVAGGALPHDLSLEVQKRIAPARFFVMYGQTEATARLAYVPPEILATIPEGCLGQAVPGVTLQVVDDHARELAPGEIGELRARGPNVMLGYWRDTAATAERIRDGWLYTGDLATLGVDGRICLKGRRNALVKIAGFRVHPADLETYAVQRLPARQAVAVPCEVEGLGTRFALYVRTDADLSVSEIISRCRAELPRHLVPEWVQVVDEFPLNAAMKIDRPLLTQWAAASVNQRRRPA